MGWTDILWMTAILSGASWLLYRSVITKKGHCPGCSQDSDRK
ncbi:FeoB-associated Cys-rich membrane protein [Trichloromonas acetexigens]|uniref:FeoB-associated Cys-rich membrane protein n=1 Tax=Trichloromonas acetexigens TaxID=38815 RepID=A0A550J941_9BACT|nr:FeoB-associated Cys-rich membrane protein [Desulfuromonas acetexigens]TRO79750.1 FeoB-associated Cys-rich membrane protein [Desulfuromonas acetexigens]